MTYLTSLWLPILLSAVGVLIVSSIIHMFLKYHSTDFKKLPSEDEVMEALRKFDIPPGDYHLPFAGSTEAMGSDEFKEKIAKGPVGLVTFVGNDPSRMVKSLLLWFVYSITVAFFAAYVAGRTLGPDAHYLTVFRVVGATTFMGHSLALLQNSIWFKRNWCATFKSMFDGLLYALVTAGIFGWLWPRG